MRRSEWGHAPFREPSGNASKGGGAANGAERRVEPRAAKGGAPPYKRRTDAGLALSLQRLAVSLQRSPPLSLQKVHGLSVSLSKGCLSLSPKVNALSLVHARSFSWRSPCASCSSTPFLLARSRARGPARPVGGDADRRRRSAACGGPARPDEGCRRGFAGRVGGRNQARSR